MHKNYPIKAGPGRFCLRMLLMLLLFTGLYSKVHATIYTIGSGTASRTTSGVTPFTTVYEDNKIQYLYLASELSTAGVPSGSVLINSVAFNITSLNTLAPANVTISIGTVPAATTNITSLQAGLSPMFTAATLSPTLGWNTYTFSSPFTWNGTDNIVVEVCRDNSSYDDNYGVECTQFGSGVSRTFGYYDDGVAGCSMTTGSTATAANRRYRPNMQFDIFPALNCNGTPNVPVASAPGTICPNKTFTLASSGASQGLGLTYSWEMNDGTGWAPVSAATTTSYTLSGGITVNTQYHLVTTCANGGATSTSNDITVNINPNPYECFCSSHSTSTTDEYISNVVSGTFTNSTGRSNYANYTGLGAMNSVMEGTSFNIDVTVNTAYPADEIHVFLDGNHDGVLTTGEEIGVTNFAGNGSGVTGTKTVTCAVPLGTLTGLTGLRIKMGDASDNMDTDPCQATYTYGEVEDYVIDVLPTVNCAGQPDPTTISGPTGVCTGTGFTLNASGASQGSGITYEWQQNDGTGWVPIPGAATTTYVSTTGITAATQFQFVTTCTNGGGSSTSNILSVAINPPTQCYCTPVYNIGCYYFGDVIDINDFSVTGENSTSISQTGTGCSTNAYADYSSLTPVDMNPGLTYTLNMSSSMYTGLDATIWIDLDNNGTFDATEVVGTVPNTSSLAFTAAVTIPVSASSGNHRMRVRATYDGTSVSDPCSAYDFGETHDYTVNILALSACAGQPNAATVNAPAGVCSGASFNLSATGATVATGITYQWEQNDGTGWAPIATATNLTYTVSSGITATMEYRFTTTCANGGGNNTSAPVTITINPFYSCYCAATNQGGNAITNVTISSTALNNSTGAAPAPDYYVAYPATGTTTANLAQGVTYAMSTTFDAASIGSVWIDFDQSGTFDVSEWTQITTNASSATINIPVPSTAVLGMTGMRVRSRTTGASNGSTDACTAMGSGETEDYIVTIIPAPSCLPPTLSVANVTITTADVSWAAVTGAAGYEYVFDQTSADPTGPGTATTNTTYPASGLAGSTTYYLHVRTDCGSGSFSPWSTISFQTAIPNDDAPGAITLTVNAGCTSVGQYTNVGSSQSANEAYGSCSQTTGYKTVWFKFTPPASGAVRVTTDQTTLGSLQDSRIALFSVADVNDYSTFTILGCDDDNGIGGSGYMSTVYATGLNPAQTYYVMVDGYSSSDEGTFCVRVDELSSSMLSGGSLDCDPLPTPYAAASPAPAYTGWVSLVDNDGKLVALVRDQLGSAVSDYEPALTINTGGVRQAGTGGQYYLDRNYLISNSVVTNPVNVQLFFLSSEVSALSTASGGGITLGNLNVTKQDGSTCAGSYTSTGGTNTVLLQTGNGSVNGASWIQVTTPSFSNFYVMAGTFVLSVELGDISASNVGSRNRVDWNTLSEQKGDYFMVERSIDGRNFTEIGTVTANGNASRYSYWDQNPAAGTNYYRLKMGDASGKTQYSKVVTATVRSENSFTIDAYPNPVTDKVTVKVYGTMDAHPQIIVTDATGKMVRSMVVTGAETVIDMNGLAQGIYLIKYADDTHTQHLKVNKH